jgi:putative sterol carrier protein
MKFFTMEFFTKLISEVNANPKFKEGIGDFSGSMIWRDTDKGFGLYFEIRNGEIPEFREAKEGEEADFILEAAYDPAWIEIGKGNMFIREAVMTGQMVVTGSIVELGAYTDGWAVLLGTMAQMPKEF